MKIVIAGAGDVGFHLAQLLSSEQQEIILIDLNEEVLEYAAQQLDVQIIIGNASAPSVIGEAVDGSASLFLAVTTHETTNLIACIQAKRLGARQTIARVQNVELLHEDQRAVFQDLGVDHLISPTELVAKEVVRLVKHCELTDYFEFEDGTISMNGFLIEDDSALIGQTIRDVTSYSDKKPIKPIAILRNNEETIVPLPSTKMMRRDHLYYLSVPECKKEVLNLLGKDLVKIKNIMILGGSPLAERCAALLETRYHVSVVELNKERCKSLISSLNHSLVIQGNPCNLSLLKEEGLDRMDAVIALTENSETNIIACLTAAKAGVYKTIALVDNTDYTHISQKIGVDTLINTKLVAANNIFRFVRKGKVEAIASLHGVDAEVSEYVIRKENQITKKPIKDLPLPNHSMIAAVIRQGESILPDQDFKLQVSDKAIIIAKDEAVSVIDRLFK